MNALLRVSAGIALACVLVLGGVAGFAVLPLAGVHVQTGPVPNGLALRIDAMPGVHVRVLSTAAAGGKPRYEFRMTGVAEPIPKPLEGRALSPTCVSAGWPETLGQRCHGELLVVVKAGRPVRIYCSGETPILPDIGDDIFVEEDTCNL